MNSMGNLSIKTAHTKQNHEIYLSGIFNQSFLSMITNVSRVHLCCPTCFRFHPKLQRKLTKMKPIQFNKKSMKLEVSYMITEP